VAGRRCLLTIYVSTSCLKDGRDLSRVLDIYEKWGIKSIELGSCHSYMENVEGLLSQYPDKRFLIHNYFPPAREPFMMNLAAQDEKVRSQSIAVCKRAIGLCSRLGYPLYSFHPGFRVVGTLDENFGLSQPVVPYEVAYEAFSSSLDEVLSYAGECGIGVAVENLEHKNDAYMMTQPEEFSRLKENYPEVGVLLDLGHLKIASRKLGFEIEDFVNCVKDNIVGIHLHENDGASDRHLEPVNSEMLGCLDEVVCRRITLECRNLNMDRIILNLTLLEDYFNDEKDRSIAARPHAFEGMK
jgi:sugar phosphate isomerase/epimerase